MRPMKTGNQRPKPKLYLLPLAVQMFGAIVFVWQQLPEFRQVVVEPGKQLPYDIPSDLITVGVLLVMQIAFWYRQLHIPIPFRRPNTVLNLVLLYLGRLSFIFGCALFSVVVFRHLPELERLGQAFEGNRN
jgi:hypothetical protein